MIKKICFFVLLLSIGLSAQTITATLQFTTADAPSAIAADTVSFVLDSQAAVTEIPVCALATTTTCTFQLPNFNTSMSHTGVLTITNDSGSAKGTFTYTPATTPGSPSNIQVVIKITVP